MKRQSRAGRCGRSANPNAQRALKSRYSRTVRRQRAFYRRGVEMFDQYDNEIKRLLASRVELANDIWMARSLS